MAAERGRVLQQECSVSGDLTIQNMRKSRGNVRLVGEEGTGRGGSSAGWHCKRDKVK